MPHPAPRRRRRLAAIAAALALAAASGSVDGLAFRDVTLALDGGRLAIGAVRLTAPLFGAALAQPAEAVVLENVALDFETVSIRFPRAAFSGTGLSRADLLALFDLRSSEGWAARLARLSAAAVTIPELVVEQRLGAGRTLSTYRNVVASEVAGGRIGRLTSAGATARTFGPAEGEGRYGRIAIEAFDAARAVRLSIEKAGAGPNEMARIYGAVAIEDLAFKDAKGAEVAVERLGARDIGARLLPEGWAAAMQRLGSAPGGMTGDGAERSRLLADLADVLGGFEVGSAELSGLAMRDPATPERPAARIVRLSYSGAAAGKPAQASADGLEVASATGTARIAALSLTGFSLASTIEGLQALARKPAAALDPADLRRLVPTIGTIRLSGLAYEGSGWTPGEPTPRKVRFGLKGVEVGAEQVLNGLPTNLLVAIDGLSFELPPDSADPNIETLRGLGYPRLDLSWRLAASWNEPGHELLLRELSFSGAEMGATTLRAVLGGISRDVFHPDTAVALVALVGATVKSLDLTFENRGLFERVLAEEARKQSKRPEELRREYGMAAAIAVPAMLGGSPQARQIGQAVARFAASPGRLQITARTREPAGLGIADLAGITQPADLLERLEVTAIAE